MNRVPLVLIVDPADRDWALPPGQDCVRQLIIWEEGELQLCRTAALESICARIEALPEDACAGSVGLPLLLALAAWNAWRGDRQTRLAERLFRLVRDLRLIEVPLLVSLTRPFREYANRSRGELPANARWLDAFAAPRPQDQARVIAESLQQIFHWSHRRHQHKGSAPSRWFGVDIETIATALAYTVQWEGVGIDLEQLDRGLEALAAPIADLDDDLRTALYGDYLAAADAVSTHGRIHPHYVLQDGKRLGAEHPHVQTFTKKGGGWASARLVTPRAGHRLLAMDVRAAEFLTMGVVWRDRYAEDSRAGAYLEDVIEGDIHTHVGEVVARELAGHVSAARIRRLGKRLNSSIVNGASDRGLAGTLREAWQEAGLTGVVRERDLPRLLRPLVRTYPVERWRQEISDYGSRRSMGSVDLPDGRRLPAADGRQFASRLTQTYFADAFALACFRLVQAGYRPAVIRFDEVVLEIREAESVEEVQAVFLAGFREGFGPVPVACECKVYDERWAGR